MKSSNNSSGKTASTSETDNPSKRTLGEVLEEIREVINNTHWVQTRLAKLESSGFEIEECWVKNGSIETMWFMKRKKVFRVKKKTSKKNTPPSLQGELRGAQEERVETLS